MPRFDFRRRRKRGPVGERQLGLVVPVRALITYKEVIVNVNGKQVRIKAGVEYDELAEREAEFRKRGRPEIIFEDDDENSPAWLGR